MTVLPLLVDSIAKASILLILATAAAFVLRRGTASMRHLVWTLGLAGALVTPVLSLALPRWKVPMVTIAAPSATSVAAPDVAGDVDAASAAMAPKLESAARDRARPMGATWWSGLDVVQLVVVIWCVGAMVVMLRMLIGLTAVQWMSRRLRPVDDAPWLPLARELAAAVGLSGVRFLQSGRASMPMAWGVLRPSVLMPADAGRWSSDRLRIVLLHELAHVKRRDCLTHLVAQMACAAHWFNPLAWLAARRLRAERERACDDLVLAAGTRGSDYADELLHIARVMHGGRFPAVFGGASLAMAHRTQLEGRLIAILDPTIPRRALSRMRAAIASTAFAVVLLPVASVQPWTEVSAAPQQAVAEAQAAGQGSGTTVATRETNVTVHTRARGRATGRAIEGGVADGVAGGVAQAVAEGIAGTVAGITHGVAGGIASGLASGITEQVLASTAPLVEEAVTQALPQLAQPPQAPRAPQTGAHKGHDPRAIAALTEALKDPDKDVRETALAALAKMRDPHAFDALVGALGDSDADVREKAAFGLGQLRDRRAIDPLTAALKDASPSVREQAVFALGQLRAHETAPSLTLALKDANADVREQAAFALGQLRSREAIPALSVALKDEKANVREQAAFALGQLRDPNAVGALTSVLHDASADVREQAVFALGQIRDARAAEPLISALKDSSPDVREQAAFSLGQLRSAGAVEALVVALKDATADVREQAAFALGQIRDPRAIDGLTAALKDENADVREQAAFALGQIR